MRVSKKEIFVKGMRILSWSVTRYASCYSTQTLRFDTSSTVRFFNQDCMMTVCL